MDATGTAAVLTADQVMWWRRRRAELLQDIAAARHELAFIERKLAAAGIITEALFPPPQEPR